jgi:asparaginyl-tRNA synthetase
MSCSMPLKKWNSSINLLTRDCWRGWTMLFSSEFGRITYTEAVEILIKNNDKFDYKVEWGTDLQTEHERYLTEKIFNKPVFVTDYPKEIKAFYMR